MTSRPLALLLVASATATATASPQAPGVAIPDQTPAGLEQEERALSTQIARLAKAGALLSTAAIEEQLQRPSRRRLMLPVPNTKKRSAQQVAQAARSAFVRVGWCFLCTHCDNWHTELACGYAITASGDIATCAHVLEKPPMPMRAASLIAVDRAGIVHPVRSIAQHHQAMDAAIVQVKATLAPLAFDDQVRPGDEAYCFSRPLDQRDYFSRGMVNRFYVDQRAATSSSIDRLATVRLDVSTAWAPGSSGAAVLNDRGNVIGHVSEIRPLNEGFGMGEPPTEPAAERSDAPAPVDAFDPQRKATMMDLERTVTLITTHVAIPARGVRALALSGKATEEPASEEGSSKKAGSGQSSSGQSSSDQSSSDH